MHSQELELKDSLLQDEEHSAQPEKFSSALSDALEVLLDAIQPPQKMRPRVEALKNSIGKTQLFQLPQRLNEISDIIAECLSSFDLERQQIEAYLSETNEKIEALDRAVQSTEQQTQASYQGTQKVGATIERQVQDITYRLRRSGNIDSLRSWLTERLGIVQTRLDEYKEQGGQTNTALHAQLQTLAGALGTLGDQSSALFRSVRAGRGELLLDNLTEIGNRVQLEQSVRQELDKQLDTEAGTGQTFIYQIWDIDNLTSINERFDRQAGDRTLNMVARLFNRHLRGSDVIYRYGSDRFVVLLPNTTAEKGDTVAQRLDKAICEAEFHHCGEAVTITVSGGYTVSRREDTLQSLHARADIALKNAKRLGGNQHYYHNEY